MDIHPILASLRRHRIPAILIVLEIALACAVLCNAVFMISQRIGAIQLSNAIDEHGIVVVDIDGSNPDTAKSDVPRNIAALKEIPGVIAVAAFNTLPLTNNGWNTDVATGPTDLMEKNPPNVATFLMSQGGERALGLRLLRGRFFTREEYAGASLGGSYLPSGHVVVVTQSLARRLWPHRGALGEQLWVGKNFYYTVVGVVGDVLRPNQNGMDLSSFHWAAFLPLGPSAALGDYVVRTNSRNRNRVLREAVTKLEALAPNAVVRGRTFTHIRNKYFADTRSMVWILFLVCVVMLVVTAFGIVGLTSFWVGQRRRQIGIRRAVGATRNHILRYFQTENFLLSTVGVMLGTLLAYAINLYLMQHWQGDRMPLFYLPVGAIALWLLGQLAVLAPALRASHVPPVVATRSV